MSTDVSKRADRARAFVPDLIPEPQDLDRTGPLDAKEQRDLERIHSARDHHQSSKWMRGKALEAAFRRRLFRGGDGQRTRQQYLDDEWDGVSESAAYLEIGQWRLAAQIEATFGRPAPDSHVRALVDVAAVQSCETAAKWYAELRTHGREAGLRVTAEVVGNLADYLKSGSSAPPLGSLFVPRQLPPAPPKPSKSATAAPALGDPVSRADATTGLPDERPRRPLASGPGAFQNFGMNEDPAATPPAQEPAGWVMYPRHIYKLNAWLTAEAQHAGIAPEHAADLLVQALTDDAQPLRDWIRSHMER